ncbi:hypothetical protein, partial [Cupriavidus sp. amp6]|uniref:hypothetical protein n=1 Tax=Cupriavidus sp. amp6 TaxID=388051 RepID=UPI001E360515
MQKPIVCYQNECMVRLGVASDFTGSEGRADGARNPKKGGGVLCVTNVSESLRCCTEDGRWPPEAGLQGRA